MKTVLQRGFATLGVWLLLILPALAADSPAGKTSDGHAGRIVLTERGVWNYAEMLFQGGEYYRAVSEYQRLLYYFPQSPWAPVASLRIGEAQIQGGEPAAGIAHLGGLLGRPGMAPFKPEIGYLRGIGRLEMDAHLPYAMREKQIRLGLRELEALPGDWAGGGRLAGFLRAMAAPPDDLPSQSPWLAGGLSAVLPGAGSAYGGRWSEAGLAFFINAVFIGATVDALREDDQGAAVVLGTLALAFYAGNIYAAVNGAQKFNDRVKAAYLTRQRVRFGIVLHPGGLQGLLLKRF